MRQSPDTLRLLLWFVIIVVLAMTLPQKSISLPGEAEGERAETSPSLP